MIHMNEIRIDTSNVNIFDVTGNVAMDRNNFSNSLMSTYDCEVTIFLLAYNRIEKTKEAVESILKYTVGIDYRLVLIDNGSEKEVLDYFRSLPIEKATILRIEKNIGVVYPYLLSMSQFNSRYYVMVLNDIVVTHNWLSNLLTCIESDPSIGFVTPLSTYVSNMQSININFANSKDMQEFAVKFNVSDPTKWQDRLRLINVITLLRREAIESVGFFDSGYTNDFLDDDYSTRVRRAGFRIVLAGDTFVHHNHDFRNLEDKDPESFRMSLERGRENYRQKFNGVDAWDDLNNFWMGDITPLIPRPMTNEKKQILGIDVRCGTPILDVKNRLREFGIFEADLSAFTQVAKYVTDLQTICTGIVACDREEFFAHQFPQNYYDYIVVDQPLNRYHEPQQMLEDWFSLLKPGGLLIFSLLNTFGFREYLYCQGQRNLFNRQFAYDIPPEAVQATVKQMGNVLFTKTRSVNLSLNDQKVIENQLPISLSRELRKDALQKLMVEKYFWGIQKNG